MPVQFSTDDLRTPESLERVLRQFQTAFVDSTNANRPKPLDINALSAQLAPLLRDQLQATGVAPLNLQSLLPSLGLGVLIEDTHANRLTLYPPSNYTVGTLFYETDRTVVYAVKNVSGALVWQYVIGVYYSTFATRPTDLGTNDTGLLYIPTEHVHWCRWGGAAWVIIDDDGGTFKESARALTAGYQLCDGTATTYLTISGADLAQTAFTTPDENTAPAGVFHKSIAAYTGTINAAVAPTFAGTPAVLTGTVSAPVFTGDLAPSSIGVTNGIDNDCVEFPYTPTGNNSAPSLTMDSYTPAGSVSSTAVPRNMGVLRYFRR